MPQRDARTPGPSRRSLLFLAAGLLTALVAAYVVFSGLLLPSSKRTPAPAAYGPPAPLFEIVSFEQLQGWRRDNVAAALPAFLASCARMENAAGDAPANRQENLGERYEGFSLAGVIADWRGSCARAAGLRPENFSGDDAWRATVREFFETEFAPVKILQERKPLENSAADGRALLVEDEGVFTGYFEPVYEARLAPEGRFQAPLYDRPADLIDVDLGRFKPHLAGERVAGRLEGARLVPYADRGAVNAGAINGRAEPIAYLDPNDLFFLQIQGSGQLRLADGTIMRVGYDGTNGQPYTSIGRLLVERGVMTVAEASMQSIRAWLENARPEDAQALREANESYVFFRALEPPPEGFGPPGAQGAPLLPGRSLAVDRRYHALGAPVFVEIEAGPASNGQAIRRLMIAQDTGGAIKGPLRGDYFWGAGAEAGARAGVMNARGKMYFLLPKRRAEALAAWQRKQ